jgi:type II secretory ATPase GspE/PulE/Tfp pilus assembly ATPase PilB-like protein
VVSDGNSDDNTVELAKGFKKKIEAYITENITELLDVILYGAIALDVSDVHIEPQEDEARLRVRLDGILQDVVFFDHDSYHHLLSRLKLLSKLKLNITDKPQDGRFTIEIPEALIEVRTSSLPSEYGESIVMRLLNPKSLISLEDLGFSTSSSPSWPRRRRRAPGRRRVCCG